MKRVLNILFAIVLLAGCQKDAPVDASVTMTYSVKPPVQFITKAAGEGSQVNILWCGVYHKKGENNYTYMEPMSVFVTITPGEDINVPLTLIRNQEYRLVFVAQHRSDTNLRTTGYTYNIKYKTGDMELNAPLTDGECLDVFVKVDHVRHVAGNEHRDITLERPVAQVNIGTSADLPASFDLTITGVPQAYNLFTGEYSQTTEEHTFAGLTPPAGGTLSVGGATYKHMTTLYIFGGNKIGGSITYGQSAKTFSNIDTAPNHKTNIVGNI